MQDSGDQFSMGGRIELPQGCTVDDAAALLSGLIAGTPPCGCGWRATARAGRARR